MMKCLKSEIYIQDIQKYSKKITEGSWFGNDRNRPAGASEAANSATHNFWNFLSFVM